MNVSTATLVRIVMFAMMMLMMLLLMMMVTMTMMMMTMVTGRRGRPPYKILELRAGLVGGESRTHERGGAPHL